MGQLNEVLIDYFNKFKMGNDCRGGDSGRQPYMHTLLASWLHATSQLLCCLRLSQAALAQAAPRQVQQQSLDEREYCANACVAVETCGSARGGRGRMSKTIFMIFSGIYTGLQKVNEC